MTSHKTKLDITIEALTAGADIKHRDQAAIVLRSLAMTGDKHLRRWTMPVARYLMTHEQWPAKLHTQVLYDHIEKRASACAALAALPSIPGIDPTGEYMVAMAYDLLDRWYDPA